ISGLNMWESHIWHWDKLKIGIVSSVLSCLMLIQAPINRWLIPNLNRWLVIVSGTLFYFTTCCILVVITHIEWGDGKAWLLLLSTFTFAVAGSILPAMQGMISEEFDDESQGEVAGVAMAVRGLAYTVASPINGYTWRVFISPNELPNWGIYVPSIIFVISGIVSLISFGYSLMIFVWYQLIQKRGEHEEEGYQAITIHEDNHSYKDKS
ncbi:major facilitator superfamily MFS_1, partial [Planoprotostelium fungivorum]